MKIEEIFERILRFLFSDLFQAKFIILTFGLLGLCCLICSFWNTYQLVISGMCLVIVLCGISEYKKVKNNDNRQE